MSNSQKEQIDNRCTESRMRFEERIVAQRDALLAENTRLREALQQALFAIPTTHGAFETVRAALAVGKGETE